MLLSLKVKDFAIIDAAELDVPAGFTVITGETGAGKSILIDALVIALGGRFSTDLIRSGASSAEVEALFDISEQPLVQARLAERDLVGDDANLLLVRRIVRAKGRGKVVINGGLSTVATLAEVVRGLADISGQHEQLSLLQPENHLAIVDAYGQLEALKDRYVTAYQAYRACLQERDNLRQSDAEALRRLDFVRFQLEEIEQLAPQPNENVALEAERKRLAHAERLSRGAQMAENLLYGEDGAAYDRVSRASSELQTLVELDAELQEPLELLDGARDALQEASRALQRYASRIDLDPERLQQVEDRLVALERLMRKHGTDISGLLATQKALADEAEELANRDQRAAELDSELQQRAVEAVEAARALSAARHQAASELDAAVRAEVADMELEGAVFETRIETTEQVEQLSLSGGDRIEFLWSANPGEPPRALAKIASGGELSRLMLAVKRLQCHTDLVSLYVFDEVDTGLGGKAADAIGRKIQSVAQGHQALAITHLAPVAARADHHLLVSKHSADGRTVSAIESIEGPRRADEVARMIDGASITKATRQAARAMLQRAQSPRKAS